ncbi:hypothetical protein JL720_7143 [Aureococcus anophagefferens]|nr:hypothetical protein JL720_7143 [Aureococcus anophagefferens]
MDLSEAEQIGVALGFEGTVSKTGYLVKRAKKSGAARRPAARRGRPAPTPPRAGANWKKRYFVLNGSSLVYYETHKKMDDAKGDLLLTVGCEVSDVDEPKRQFCFEISTNNEALRLSATSEAERDAWKAAIADTVSLLGSTCQSYLSIDVRGVFGTKTTRKFFVLHGSALTYHADHHSTYKKQGEFKLHSGSRVEPRGDCGLEVASGEKTITLVAKSGDDAWLAGVEAAIAKLVARDDLASKRSGENDEQVLLDGYLATQPLKAQRDDPWPLRFYALTSSALYKAEDKYSLEALNVYLMEPTCSVYHTRLYANAFELVTTQGALHLYGSSKEETEAWIDALRGAIANSRGLSSDPLLSAAKRIPLETYDVHFATKQKLKLCGNQIFNPTSMLNIVLERAAEWAVVKHVRAPAAGGSPSAAVTEGSALVAVDGDSTMIAPYQDTIKRLTGWQPPLTLTFARAPVLSGWLHKQARGRSARTGGASGAKNNWKERYFVLKESKLSYYTSKDDEESLKDRIHLMGSVVSLVPNQESGRHFTFRVVSGCAVLVMQATTARAALEAERAAKAEADAAARAEAERARRGRGRAARAEAAPRPAAARRRAAALAEAERSRAEEAAARAETDAALERAAVEAAEAELKSDRVVRAAAAARRPRHGPAGAAGRRGPRRPPRRRTTPRPATTATTTTTAARGRGRHEVDLTAPLEEGELDAVFHVVHADKGFLNTMQFIALLRAIGASADGNLKFELDLFHDPHVADIIRGVRHYKKRGTVEL